MFKKFAEAKIEIERDNLVVRRESDGTIAGTERMMALGGGIRARLAKTKDGMTVVNEFLFDRNRFDESAVETWLQKNEDSITRSVAAVQENAPKGSFSDITMRLSKAINDAELFPGDGYGCCSAYVSWVFKDYVVADYQGSYFRIDYTEDSKGVFTFSEPVTVDMEFVTRESSALNEKLARQRRPNCGIDGNIKLQIRENTMDKAKREVVVVLIEAGTNFDKRRHYPKKTIQESAHLYAGLKMYLDHPTAEEEESKPERSVNDWLSTIVESWHEDGSALGRVKVHKEWFWNLLESDPIFREQIGISINASGRRSMGQISGQQMEIIEEIVAPKSVDWVTEPGARGRVLELLESNSRKPEDKNIMWKTLKEVKENAMNLLKEYETEIRETLKAEHEADKAKAVREAVAPVQQQLDELKGQDVKAKSTAKIKELVEASKLPKKAHERAIAAIEAKNVALDKIEEAAKAVIESELAYLSEVAGVKIGAGPSANTDGNEKLTESLEKRLGIPAESQAAE